MAPYSNNQTSHLFASAGGWTDKVSREPGARFPAEKGRYHLYTGLFCPCEWISAYRQSHVTESPRLVAQRALILLKLKGITEDVISTSIVHWFKGCPGVCSPLILCRTRLISHADDQNVFPGWHFATEEEQAETPGCTLDNLYGSYWLSEIYKKSDPQYKGRFTVPVLWDKKTETIVNNESFDIMRMLSTEFDEYVETFSAILRRGVNATIQVRSSGPKKQHILPTVPRFADHRDLRLDADPCQHGSL
jgi:putative glutathione S-transferase